MKALQQIGQEKEMTTGSGRKFDEKGLFFTKEGKNNFWEEWQWNGNTVVITQHFYNGAVPC